jgi:SAM-dependent methyltransferase
MSNDSDWNKYFKITYKNAPREMVQKTMLKFLLENKKGKVIDIGAGAGNDVRYMLYTGWKVKAIDKEIGSIKSLEKSFKNHPDLDIQCASFEEMKLEKVDWINASYVLPFCEKKYLDILMKNIASKIKKNGRFSGNFFGKKHSWNHLALCSKSKVLSYFTDFEIEYFKETKEQKKSTFGEDVFFHNYDIIARRI